MHRLDQGSAAAALGCDDGGGTGIGLQWGQRHCGDRARGTRTRLRAQVIRLGARMRAGHGHGWARAQTRAWQQELEAMEWLRNGRKEPGHWREQIRGGLEERNESE